MKASLIMEGLKIIRELDEHFKKICSCGKSKGESYSECSSCWYKLHKDEIIAKDKAYRKMYYENNKEYISKKRKEYNEQNKDKLKKAYNEKKDEINRKRREMYQLDSTKRKNITLKSYYNNKHKYLAKITCECGLTYAHKHKARHERSKTHIFYLTTI